MRLQPATPAAFAWMLGEGPGPEGLALPPGGVDAPEVLRLLRGASENGGGETWMMVSDSEVVGLCGLKHAHAGTAEIGYGVAASRRRRGHAGTAVPSLLGVLATKGFVTAAAETGPGNRASERVLERAGFGPAGARETPGGPMRLWWRSL